MERDMAIVVAVEKPAANESEPIRDEDLKQSQAPQPPFLSDGPELVRDSHC
jgi:hypothetical protein